MPVPEPFASEYRVATDREIRSWSFGLVTKTRVPNFAPLDDYVGTLADQRILTFHRLSLCVWQIRWHQKQGHGLRPLRCKNHDDRCPENKIRAHRIPAEHPFDSSVKMGCFPVIAAVYLESRSGTGLCLHYEQLLPGPASIDRIPEPNGRKYHTMANRRFGHIHARDWFNPIQRGSITNG